MILYTSQTETGSYIAEQYASLMWKYQMKPIVIRKCREWVNHHEFILDLKKHASQHYYQLIIGLDVLNDKLVNRLGDTNYWEEITVGRVNRLSNKYALTVMLDGEDYCKDVAAPPLSRWSAYWLFRKLRGYNLCCTAMDALKLPWHWWALYGSRETGKILTQVTYAGLPQKWPERCDANFTSWWQPDAVLGFWPGHRVFTDVPERLLPRWHNMLDSEQSLWLNVTTIEEWNRMKKCLDERLT